MTDPRSGRRRLGAILFAVAAGVFLLTAWLGDGGGAPAFFVLAMAFIVLAADAWQSARAESPPRKRQSDPRV